ncbi:Hypothetical predicted protein [Olea europaea subsp. europaea]|uniref:Uncharacterized protein n=1 Tax=Olea europaea subsp. europaea TaxID=158383 RepID=A0A8S0U266_OLEEU|nr:Hypothetical predicted protein [Olea europaea subsp. europaea]
MASPSSQSDRVILKTPTTIKLTTPKSGSQLLTNPSSGSTQLLKTPLSDEVVWKKLIEAGFDEEFIKRRDKAALIAYIAKFEAKIYEHQHHMGLLILEKKEWVSNYEQAKTATELKLKHEQATHTSNLANARKREDSLKKAVGIEKECVKNIEKSLHEMCAELAEAKVAAENKLTKAQIMVENAQKKFMEAEEKLHVAKLLEADASWFH